jgi:hypothetical protein
MKRERSFSRQWGWLLAFASLLALFFASPVLAADFYVAQSQAGSNTGADCADAHAYTWFNTSGNWANPKETGKIGPGDTVHVCGTLTGSANSSILTFQGSGSPGSPITLKFETGAGLTAPYCASAPGGAQGCITMSSVNVPHSYLVVDGGTSCGWNTATNASEGTCNGYIANTENGTGLSYANFSSGIEMDACTGCEVKNMLIYNIYQHEEGVNDGDSVYQQQNCINFSGSNNLIHDSTFHDAGWCIINSFNNGDTNNKVYNNNVYNMNHGMAVSAGGAINASNLYFYGNYIHDYAIWNGSGAHGDGIHAYANSSNGNLPTLTGFYIYNNIFGGDVGTILSSQVYLEGATNPPWNGVAIFNNVMAVNQPDANGILCFLIGDNTDSSVGAGDLVYNNTIIDTSSTVGGTNACMVAALHSGDSNETLIFKNNAFQNASEFIMDNVSGYDPGVTANYNAYSLCGGGCWDMFMQKSGGTPYWSSAQGTPAYLNNPYGQDLNSVAVLPIGSGSLGLNSSYVPSSASSIVVGNGVNLSRLCVQNGGLLPNALCSDLAGNPRPANGAWDIGAYQSQVILPPINLRIDN